MANHSSTLWNILLATLFIASALSCEEGCIRCGLQPDNTQTCDICDLYSSFYLNAENKCVQRKIENCLIPSADQNNYLCAQCKQGMMLDPTIFKCIDIPQAKVVSNCRQYSLVGNCIQCFRNYFLDQAACKPVKVLIPHCQVYFNDDLCAQCENNYFFDVEKSACVKFEPIENCGKHTFGECSQCQKGFYLNSNPDLQATMDTPIGQTIAQNLWEGSNFTKYPISPCVANQQSHCATKGSVIPSGSTVPLCGDCEDGYYMNSFNSCHEDPHWRIENCIEYMNINTCKKCSDGYYVHINQCVTRKEIEFCELYQDRKNLCHKCVEGYYNQNNTGACFERQYKSVEKCTQLSTFSDDCQVCDSGFTLTDDWVKCLPEINNCKTYDLDFYKEHTFLTCSVCQDDFYLSFDFKSCIPQNVTNCKDYKTGTGQCETCEAYYELDIGTGKCLDVNFTGCALPQTNNTCATCSNLYTHIGETYCEPIDNPNCLENVQNSENCQECKPNYFADLEAGGSKVVCKLSTTAKNVQFCEKSSDGLRDQNKICTLCSNSYTPFEITTFYLPNPTSCASAQDTTGKCTQCEKNSDIVYDSTTSSYTCSPAANSNSKCISQNQSKTSVLGDNDGECLECRNPKSYFLQENICYERSGVVSAQCMELSPSEDKCLKCQEGFTARQVAPTESIQCADTPTGFSPVPNCLVHNIVDPSKCVFCEWTYWLNPQFKCVISDQPIKYKYNNLNTVSLAPNSHTKSTPSTDCIFMDNTGACLKCAPGKLLIVNSFASYFNGDKYGLPFEFASGVCTDLSLLVKKKVDNDFVSYVKPNECSSAHVKSSAMVACQACANGVNANVVAAQFSYDSSINVSSSKILTVESCTISPGQIVLSKKFTGLWYRTAFSNEHLIKLQKDVQYDSCPNPSDSLIAIINTDYSNNLNTHQIPGDGVTPEPKYRCHNFTTGGVPNCQVYAAAPSTTAGFDYSSTAKCIACKPGFKATVETTTNELFLTACTAIPDCDTSDQTTNTWMNACQTCSGNKKYPWASTLALSNQEIDISSCVDNSIPKCIHQLTTKCYLCDFGHKLSGDQTTCDTITPPIEGCETMGFNPDSLQNDASNPILFKTFLFEFLRMRFKNRQITGPCRKCQSGKAHFILGDYTANLSCTATATLPPADLIQNCKLYTGDTIKTCDQCADGFILNIPKDKCIDNTQKDFPNCAVLNDTGSPKSCQTCVQGYLLNSETKKCFTIPNCAIYTTKAGPIYECAECKDYFMVDQRSKTECVSLAIPNCVKVDSQYKCIQCESGFVFFEKITAPAFRLCVKNPYDSEQLKNFSIEFTTPLNNNANHYTLVNPPKTYKIAKPGVFQVQQVCPRFLVPHCGTPNFNDMTCEGCSAGYYTNSSTQACSPITISNCKTQANQYECSTCNDNFFVNQLKSCSPHQVRFCKVKNSNSDECINCLDQYWKDSTDKTCHLRMVTNCKTFLDEADNCETCKDDFYMLNKKCLPYTVSGCKTFEENKDRCRTCRDKYYIDGSSGFKCLLNTAKYCKTWANDSNKCDDCLMSQNDTTHKQNFIKSGNLCVEFKEISGCAKYSIDPASSPGTCLECKNTHLLIGDKCVLMPNGIPHCGIYANPEQCERCVCNYFLNSGTSRCEKVDHQIPDCVYHESQDTCKECNKDYILSVDSKKCIQVTQTTCQTWFAFDSCDTCVGTQVLVPTGNLNSTNEYVTKKCENGISKCIKHYNSTVDDTTTALIHTCESCMEGYLPAEDSKSCLPTKFIPFCMVMKTHDTCQQCDPNHVLSLDHKSCSTEGELVGKYCAKGMITDKIKCGQCANGFYMNQAGACEKCGGEGCAVCSSSNISKCELCAAGFFMADDLTCKSNPNNPFSLDKETVDGGDPLPVVNQG